MRWEKSGLIFSNGWFKGAFKTMRPKDAEVNATDDIIVLKLSID